ncbi:MAG TPA: SagB/ThcOx family dehydrogenase [bacterium]|nr:SagB/ThcOx family dehydrogenase [bacterium]
MKKTLVWIAVLAVTCIGTGRDRITSDSPSMETGNMERIQLPEPDRKGDTPVGRALQDRRSVREYGKDALTLADVAQLLWAGQGKNDPGGYRTAPSAGATYPLEMYAVAGNVAGLSPGVYRYRPDTHELERHLEGDKRADLSAAALGQRCVREGAVVLVISAVYERTTRRYGDRGVRYVHMEVGHAGQNIHLQAAALNLGTVVVGAFGDEDVKHILNLPGAEHPLYLMPVGRKP